MMDMEKDLENMFIIIFGSLVTTIYFSLSIPSLVEFFTGKKTSKREIE